MTASACTMSQVQKALDEEYPYVENGERITVPLGSIYSVACCDCGLVHDRHFEVKEDGSIIIRSYRNDEETARQRTRRGICATVVKEG